MTEDASSLDTQVLRVLLLENSRFDVELICSRLVGHYPDARVRVVDRADEFTAALQGGMDLVLSGHELPGFGGLRALELARAHAPGVPFIFVSGVIGEDNAVELLKRGATDCISKQRLERLPMVVERALREARTSRSHDRARQQLREVRASLHEQQGLLMGVLASTESAIFAKDLDGRYILANEGMARLFQRPLQDVIGRTDAQMLDAASAATLRSNDLLVQRGGGTVCFEEAVTRVGMRHCLLSTKTPLHIEQRVAGVVGMAVDATERKRMEARLAELNATLERRVAERTAELERNREVLQTVADQLPAMVALVDAQLRYRFVNKAYAQCRAATLEKLVGRTIAQILGERRSEILQPYLQRALAGQHVIFEQTMPVDGTDRHVEVNYVPQHDAQGRADGFMVLVYDITERKQLELQLSRDATHDGLTGLPNRRHLMELLSQAMLCVQRLGQPLALLFLDLDGFKAVNDTHGHEAGDQLLQAVAQRLRQSVRRTDTVARLAGDEFVVVLQGVPPDVEQLVDKVRNALAAPVVSSGGQQLRVDASIGMARYAGGADITAQALLAQADAAMYDAKRSKRAPLATPAGGRSPMAPCVSAGAPKQSVA